MQDKNARQPIWFSACPCQSRLWSRRRGSHARCLALAPLSPPKIHAAGSTTPTYAAWSIKALGTLALTSTVDVASNAPFGTRASSSV